MAWGPRLVFKDIETYLSYLFFLCGLSLWGQTLCVAVLTDNGPSLWAGTDRQSLDMVSPPTSFHVSTIVKALQDPQILCGLTCAGTSHTCVGAHSTHTCAIIIMHAPHAPTTDYVGLSSPCLIRLRLWCGIPWSLRNTVLGNEAQ